MANLNVHIKGGQAFWGNLFFSPHDRLEFSYNFVIGIRWILFAESDISSKSISVHLFPESEDPPPLVRASLLVAFPLQNIGSTVHEGLLRTRDNCSVTLDFPPGCCQFDIVVEFSEIKVSDSDGGEDIPVFPVDERPVSASTRGVHICFSRMLKESLLTDITINTTDAELRAHRAVLSARSPVFHSMFTHDLKEKRSSIVDIVDMTSESCTALLSYMYGTISRDDFWKHRLALLAAADKYSMPDLKDACEESLLEDINSDNVLERLQEACLYQLSKLKKGCMAYLLDSGKICDLREALRYLLRNGDRKLLEEIFQGIIRLKKGEGEESRDWKRKKINLNE